MEADQTLLGCLDDASSKYQMKFNFAVIRKALKHLMYDDLKLCDFAHMTTTAFEIIKERFVEDTDDPDTTVETFYGMTCGQVLEKLANRANGTIRKKDRVES